MLMNIKILVCGGRWYANHDHVFHVLDKVHAERHVIYLITGDGWRMRHGCRVGADWLAVCWARERGVSFQIFSAEWDLHGRGGGPIRNQQMAEEDPDLCVAFPGRLGTADMVRRAMKRGVEVLEA